MTVHVLLWLCGTVPSAVHTGPSIGADGRMVDGHQGWPEQLCRSGPAALDRLACFYYYYYY